MQNKCVCVCARAPSRRWSWLFFDCQRPDENLLTTRACVTSACAGLWLLCVIRARACVCVCVCVNNQKAHQLHCILPTAFTQQVGPSPNSVHKLVCTHSLFGDDCHYNFLCRDMMEDLTGNGFVISRTACELGENFAIRYSW